MNVTARFCEEGSTSTVKTLSQIVGGGKGTLTAALETFQKESNDYLTQCIEKSSKLSSDGGISFLTKLIHVDTGV